MAIVRWRQRNANDPWRDFRSLQEEINDLFDSERWPVTSGIFDRTISPPVDVVESPDAIHVFCEIPGIDIEDLDVSITSNVLTIKGEKKQNAPEKAKRKTYKQESWVGSFQRTLSLPTTVGSGDKVQAELKDGVLHLTLPKREEAKPKQISVNVRS